MWHEIDCYFVEEIKPVRRVMKKLDKSIDIDRMTFSLINEHQKADLDLFDQWVMEGKDIALMSDAGTVAVADPGSELVMYAHDRGIQVVPKVSPSSIMLALMASGLDGNVFSFRGYLSIDKKERKKEILEMESRCLREGETILCMDAPYRNNKLMEDLLRYLSPKMAICVATDLTANNEIITTRSVADWKNHKPELHKRNTMFVIGKFSN